MPLGARPRLARGGGGQGRAKAAARRLRACRQVARWPRCAQLARRVPPRGRSARPDASLSLRPASASSRSSLGVGPAARWSPSPSRSFGGGNALGPSVTPAPLSLPAAEPAQRSAQIRATAAAPSASSASASRETAAVASGGLSVARENARPQRQAANNACLREHRSEASCAERRIHLRIASPRRAKATQRARCACQRPMRARECLRRRMKASVSSGAAARKWGLPRKVAGKPSRTRGRTRTNRARTRPQPELEGEPESQPGRSSVLEHMFR